MVRRSLMCSQRPSSSCASKVRAPGCAGSAFGHSAADAPARGRPRSRSRRRCRGSTTSSGSLCRRWKCELQSTRRFSASHSTKASGMVSIASRSRRSASTVRSTRLFCSVMSTAMPIRCRPRHRPVAAPARSAPAARSSGRSACRMRKVVVDRSASWRRRHRVGELDTGRCRRDARAR